MLDKEMLLAYVAKPQGLSLNDVMLLETATKKYPYFQMGYTLVAKGLHSKEPNFSQDAIRKAAIYANNRNALRKLIENQLEWLNMDENAKKPNPVQIQEEVMREDSETKLLAEIEHSAERSIQEEQLAIIDRFIKAEPRISPVRHNHPSEEIEDLSANSTVFASTLLTEPMAKIFIRQGRFDKAIEVYEQLMMKKTEKSVYFAEKIEEIKRKMAREIK